MKLLVYSEHSLFDDEVLEAALDSLPEDYPHDPVEVVVRTGMGQLDIEMERWAHLRGIPNVVVNSPNVDRTLSAWRVFNNHLILYGRPDMVLVFPGKAAEHMVTICTAQHIRVKVMEDLA